ncbi:TetR/AcrR family transcriptional regulator [Pontixanthobacter aestiaquae]|uniref:TetR family transcriptional regulator n=1 Tax=Pontixanthobacter aestiaquae TaxID=1509367 RepID=A0A844ZBX7_9SPHN|nr:TetR/AcrR family transcriptional regulator [Pontixanthobacter aestiaquae]MDN3645663.1 TetR/AcrR family transcriptional regulator [Pontixanthobacter aestiaquae]MXO83339.1 TetR family transcriptional regulator [Pontixanthobacter aestiaquae]
MANRKTQQRTLDTRAAIKTAGAELFATRGYAVTGVREIAEMAGCNQALVSYHFGSKGGLYDEILADAVTIAQKLAGESDIVHASRPERELVHILAKAIGSQHHLAPMLVREMLDPDRLLNTETANTLRSFMALTEAVLDALPLDAEARRWDPQIVHLCVVGPLIHYSIATRMREEIAPKLKRPITLPTLEEFVEVQSAMLSRALQS